MCILTDIIVPLGSALIGGVLALGGVFLTVTEQHKKTKLQERHLLDRGYIAVPNRILSWFIQWRLKIQYHQIYI